MAITASQVKALRESTGAGMMDAKRALTETDGDMDAAVDWLRTKASPRPPRSPAAPPPKGSWPCARGAGSASPSRSTPRPTSWPATPSSRSWSRASARPRSTRPTSTPLRAADLGGKSVADTITDKVATIGENLALRRMERIEGGSVVSYVHNAASTRDGSHRRGWWR